MTSSSMHIHCQLVGVLVNESNSITSQHRHDHLVICTETNEVGTSQCLLSGSAHSLPTSSLACDVAYNNR